MNPIYSKGQLGWQLLGDALRGYSQKKQRDQLSEILSSGDRDQIIKGLASSRNPKLQQLALAQLLATPKQEKSAKPFGSGFQASIFQQALGGDINDPATIAAYQQMGADKVTVDPITGQKVTIKGFVPPIIQNRFAVASPESDPVMETDERVTIGEAKKASQIDVRKYRDEFGVLEPTMQTLDSFGQVLEEEGVQPGVDIAGISFSLNPKARQRLKTAYTAFMGELKGPGQLALGVLAGPDLDIIEGMLPPPTEIGSAIQAGKYLQGYNSAVDYVNNKIRAYNKKWEGTKVPVKEFTKPRKLDIGADKPVKGDAPGPGFRKVKNDKTGETGWFNPSTKEYIKD
jgi:hypothetical protein